MLIWSSSSRVLSSYDLDFPDPLATSLHLHRVTEKHPTLLQVIYTVYYTHLGAYLEAQGRPVGQHVALLKAFSASINLGYLHLDIRAAFRKYGCLCMWDCIVQYTCSISSLGNRKVIVVITYHWLPSSLAEFSDSEISLLVTSSSCRLER